MLQVTALAVLMSLDNTINNAFWNTTAYVNAQPEVVTVTAAEAIDAATVECACATIPEFDSYKPGFLLLFQ